MTNWIPHLDGRAGPRYRAIADAIAEDVASGRLAPLARLPTHRELAFALGVTVGTVTRAYAEAERRGLIGGEIGRGTFVRSARDSGAATSAVPPAAAPWQPASGPVTIDLSVCQPHPVGVEQALAASLQAIAASGGLPGLLDYGPHGGAVRHRAAGAQWVTAQHRALATPETLLLTLGAQNGLAVALAAVARPGDLMLTEALTYHGAKALAATLGLRLEGVAMDQHGLIPDALEAACRRGAPRVLYCMPTLHNPTAGVLPAERRAAVAEIARRWGVTILEDDVFGFLAADAPPPIQTLAPDITLYVTSLSKSVAAGLRLGFVVAPPAVVPRLEAVIRAMVYAAPGLLAEVAARWIGDGTAAGFAEAQRREAAARQQLARRLLPAEAVCGHAMAQHLWLMLPEPWRREEYVAEMRRRGVALTGADVFVAGRGSAPHAVRVGLCMPTRREEVEQGLQRLADALSHPAVAGLAVV